MFAPRPRPARFPHFEPHFGTKDDCGRLGPDGPETGVVRPSSTGSPQTNPIEPIDVKPRGFIEMHRILINRTHCSYVALFQIFTGKKGRIFADSVSHAPEFVAAPPYRRVPSVGPRDGQTELPKAAKPECPFISIGFSPRLTSRTRIHREPLRSRAAGRTACAFASGVTFEEPNREKWRQSRNVL